MPTPDPTESLGAPVFETVGHDPDHSFYWHTHGFPSPLAQWNYHPEYELHLIRHSHGRFMVGDHTARFGPGNLVLVGPNVPHCWFSDLDDAYQAIADRDVVLQFRGEWLAPLARLCPELRRLDPLLAASARGVQFFGAPAARAARRLEAMGDQPGTARLAAFIDIVGELAASDYRPLASRGWRLHRHGMRSAQVDATLRHIHRHFDGDLRMGALAQWQGMPPATFSRWFKQATGETFTVFVRRLRIDYACRLLRDSRQPVAQVAFMAGYANLSNFNRHFRRVTGTTPRAYRRGAGG